MYAIDVADGHLDRGVLVSIQKTSRGASLISLPDYQQSCARITWEPGLWETGDVGSPWMHEPFPLTRIESVWALWIYYLWVSVHLRLTAI
jgi:hypothetical protein